MIPAIYRLLLAAVMSVCKGGLASQFIRNDDNQSAKIARSVANIVANRDIKPVLHDDKIRVFCQHSIP